MHRRTSRSGSIAVEHVLTIAFMVLALGTMYMIAKTVMGNFYDFGAFVSHRPWL
ncbi:MAG: hypothetical protein ACK52S_01780 [Pirellula sp.]|jgi:hypothetical protein